MRENATGTGLLVEAIRNLASDTADCDSFDVRIRCKDHRPSDGLGAHKLILAAASPDFLLPTLLDADPVACIHLADYTSGQVRTVLSLLYRGEARMGPEALRDCRQLLNDFRISGPEVKNDGDDDNDDKKPRLVCAESERCNYSTDSLSRFQSHRLVHHRRRQRSFSCPKCPDFRAAKEAELKAHVVRLHFDHRNRCDHEGCGAEFADAADFYRHFGTAHDPAGWLECDQPGCGHSTRDASNMSRHLATHNGDGGDFDCSVCGKRFATGFNLAVHARAVHTKERPFRCRLCDKRFATDWQRKSHARTNHTKNKQQQQQQHHDCRRCQRSFLKRQSLAAHMKSCRSGDDDDDERSSFRVCETCGRKTTSLGRHRCRGDDDDDDAVAATVKCPKCSKSVPSRSLASHARYHESQEVNRELLGCAVCARRFTTAVSLKRHLLIHENRKPWKCDACDKSFRQKGTLESHRRVHSGRRLACPAAGCAKSFTTRSLLNQHRRLSLDCGRAFIETSSTAAGNAME